MLGTSQGKQISDSSTMPSARVLLDDIIYGLQRVGGVSKYWHELTRRLVDVSDLEFWHLRCNEKFDNVFDAKETTLTIPFRSLLPLHLKKHMYARIGGGWSIFHSSYYRVAPRTTRLRQVVTVHDFMYELYDRGYRKWAHERLKGAALRYADAIICVSRHTRNDMHRLYPDTLNTPTYVVPNGVSEDFTRLPGLPGQVEVQGHTFERHGFVLYVGNRHGCKNFKAVPTILSQSRLMRRERLKLVCVGGGEITSQEAAALSACGVRYVHFSRVMNSELNTLYNAAHCLLMPSLYEGYGIPAIEAQRAGCPVVYAQTSSLPEVVGYSDTGFPVADLSHAAASLDSVADSSVRKRLIQQGIGHAGQYSWDRCATATANVYRETLGRNS